MKKALILLLALLLTLPAGLAESAPRDENAQVTAEEIQMYLDSLAAQVAALDPEDTQTSLNDDGTATVAFPGGYLTIADDELTETSAVLLADLFTPDAADLRGLRVGDTLDDIFALYPNDNPTLAGTYYEATLFMAGEEPETSMGYLLREGQQILNVTFDVLSWKEDGALFNSVIYLLDHGVIDEIFIGGLGNVTPLEDARRYVSETAMIQELNEYFAYPHSENGETIAPFEREDLTIRAVGYETGSFDLLDLTYEDVIAAFGPAQVDEWTEDSTGELLRTLQWEGVSLLLVYDGQKNFLRADSLTINDTGAEGPRGVKVGDLLDEVIFRFRHLDEYAGDSRLLLYGDGQQAPYGVLEYTPESAELTYALALEEGKTVVWHLTFGSGALQSMSLLLR